jgi:hypothetical protein
VQCLKLLSQFYMVACSPSNSIGICLARLMAALQTRGGIQDDVCLTRVHQVHHLAFLMCTLLKTSCLLPGEGVCVMIQCNLYGYAIVLGCSPTSTLHQDTQ